VLFHQLALKDFANFGTLRIDEPLAVCDLLALALAQYVRLSI
jgi:hypothetical protein